MRNPQREMESALLFIAVFLLIWGINYVTRRRRPGATLGRQIRGHPAAGGEARPFTAAERQQIRQAERALAASRAVAESNADYATRLHHYNEMVDQLDAVKRLYQAAVRPEIEAVEQRRQDVLIERTALVHAYLETMARAALAEIDALPSRQAQQDRLNAFLRQLSGEGVYATHAFLEDLNARIQQFAARSGLQVRPG